MVLMRLTRGQGRGANVLAFNWWWDEFRAFIGRPDQKLDWHGQPWLHHAYDKFLISKLTETE